ncbi:salt-induced outer membrane protein [Thiosulfatimonas sediminis]|uniref:Salt-induced outer membrane protein n=1 Tax=Thiosulfatimonas sediminis TaxID=2675054 RepID=A0A6F8PUZ6_9GAMM|nr:DUF481 domain-containing protein [Thiosulfatimonas sediminis]BBP45916.1 salt-induced outer membrane protein [Thiosulfatimonas sediminis]
MKAVAKYSQSPITKAILAGAMFSVSAVSFADNGLKGSGELGYSDTSGNTESTSLYASLKLTYNLDAWEIKSLLEANYQEESQVQTQERYLFDLQGNRYYNASRSYYSFAGARLEKSKFEGIALDSTLTAGLGKTLYKTDATKLTAELGAGYQNIEYTATFGNGSEDQLIGRVKADLAHKFNENVDFGQDLTTTLSDNNTKIEANSALKVKLAEKMRLSAGFKYRYNSDPATGARKVDKQTLLTLVFDF